MLTPMISPNQLAWLALSLLVIKARADQVLSRIVNTKYGRIQGSIRHHATPSLPPIELFLGVPYAIPPIGERRFAPTSSPLPWDSVKRCLELPPVCPQPLPDESYPPNSLPADRLAYLKSLRPLLRRQSENCLYLNIYAPHDGGGRYPVMVFIQGETFWWGSGNLYDGGVLASYGQVVVVTLNYRLGPLGFLNTSPSGASQKVVGNQGLMDQLAALSWVQDNIAYFGGDSSKVTLFGHGAGAACISYLMVSPVLVSGLFQRAILMSGTAFSKWAEVEDGISVTARLAKELNCSLPSDLNDQHPETMVCLRNVSAQAIVNVAIPKYKFASSYGPSVDGVVITHDFKMRIARELQGRNLSIMLGVTEGDAYPELTHKQAVEGLTIKERNRMFRTYVRNSYNHHLQEIYLAMSKEYTDWGNPSQNLLEVRDLTVEAISDASFVAPMTRMAEIISHRTNTYIYVYSHHRHERQRLGSIFGSELPLMFGGPFHDPTTYPLPSSPSTSSSSRASQVRFNDHFGNAVGSGSIQSNSRFSSTEDFSHGSIESKKHVSWISPNNFSRSDALVSEIIMKLWTNFARTGNPNIHDEGRPNLSYPDRSRFRNVTWDKYDHTFEKYLEISSRPRLRDHYRAHKVALWNWLLPELRETGSRYPDTNGESWYTPGNSDFFIGPVRPLDPFRFLEPSEQPFTSPLPMLPNPLDNYIGPNVSAAHGSKVKNSDKHGSPDGSLLDYSTALTLTIIIGVSMLVLNIILFGVLLYNKDRQQSGAKMNYDSVSVQPLCTVDSGLRSGSTGGPEGATPPGKDLATTCSTDIQITEMHSFSTPPDIGDRNTDFSSYTTNNAPATYSCSGMPTSQFVPPPPLLSSSSSSSPLGVPVDGGGSTSISVPMECTNSGAIASPCSNSSCYQEGASGPYQQNIGSSIISESNIPSSSKQGFQNNPTMGIISSPSMKNLSGGSTGVQGIPPCNAGGICPGGVPQSSFLPSTSTYCPVSQYCSDFPPAQYNEQRFIGTPNHYSTSTCQFSSKEKPLSSFSCQNQRQQGVSSGQRSATLNRTNQNQPCHSQNTKKPKPPPRDSSGNPGFATLPRQSSLDSSSHITT